jgi:hypothetical protein
VFLGSRTYKVNFVDACNLHDAGYSEAIVKDKLAHNKIIDYRKWSRLSVDTQFHNNLLYLCRHQIPADQTAPLKQCATTAEAMYLAVRAAGGCFWRPYDNMEPWVFNPNVLVPLNRWQTRCTSR